MIAFLLANRTLSEVAGALVLVGLIWAAWLHHDRAMEALGEERCEAKLTETRAQAATAAAAQTAHYETLIQPAEVQHAKDLASIPARVVTTPIWLHDGKICAGAVPQVPETSGTDSASGGAVPGPGRDLRPALEQFRAKYETALADCRRLNAEWPQ